ncbi:hypothetical protein K402DRAFT_395940 [Aulographum hederae CBS 113979]|uniref:ATP-grasp domain-containing protein n=1 Tax=Aulographum hederae CBS 113979 TaxID=1176131 RepID=A0A6G1GU58_9PEZI|nr:hypothetical protein K402DRAFT_395940 [Aulographum hederae CBS 113979]
MLHRELPNGDWKTRLVSKGLLSLLFSPGEKPVPADIELRTSVELDGSSGTQAKGAQYWTLDMFVHPPTQATETENGKDAAAKRSELDLVTTESKATLFLQGCIKLMQETQQPIAAKLLFASRDGHAARSDFLEQRLICCEHVAKAASFLLPLQATSGFQLGQLSIDSLLEILPKAIGGLLLHPSDPNNFSGVLDELEADLSNRISFPWLSAEPFLRRRVVWVQGRENIDVSRQAYEAARALGITLVVIDSAGHWLEDDNGPHAHLREAFIPVNIDFDVGFVQRIVDAVRGYPHPVDGMVTISDVRLPLVAMACEILGLPTSPSDAYVIAADKAKTRMLEPSAAESFVLSHASELPGYLTSRQGKPLSFPLIVKPCLGWNSDCVSKVANEEELEIAVREASERHEDAPNPSTKVVIEPYIDGPEVDANMVLLDGEILFFEISDDFPSRGDAAGANHEADFQETKVVMPTGLPESETQALRTLLRDSILRQGFKSGIFHCEARIRYSRVKYTEKDGILDLETKSQPPSEEISVYLHEINARPPGYLESVAVSLNYGVDYFALRLLLSLGPSENTRLRALAQPFLKGPQFHLSITILPQTRAGVMKTADAGAEFLEKYAEVRKRVVDYETQMKGGAVLEGPLAKALWWVAYFSMTSRVSRQDCLRWVKFIEDKFTYELE